ncbi:unnamed protein product [Boreogadus saida]
MKRLISSRSNGDGTRFQNSGVEGQANKIPCSTAGSYSTPTKRPPYRVQKKQSILRAGSFVYIVFREQQQQQILCQQRLVHRLTSRKAPKSLEGAVEHQQPLETRLEASLRRMIQHTLEPIMMT